MTMPVLLHLSIYCFSRLFSTRLFDEFVFHRDPRNLREFREILCSMTLYYVALLALKMAYIGIERKIKRIDVRY